jgi:hypothetical protein
MFSDMWQRMLQLLQWGWLRLQQQALVAAVLRALVLVHRRPQETFGELKAAADEESATQRFSATRRRPPWDMNSSSSGSCCCVWRPLPQRLRRHCNAEDNTDRPRPQHPADSTSITRTCPACGGAKMPWPTLAEWTTMVRINCEAQPPHAALIFGVTVDEGNAERQIHGTLEPLDASGVEAADLRQSCGVDGPGQAFVLQCRHLQDEMQDSARSGPQPLLLSGLSERVGLVFLPSLAAAEQVRIRFVGEREEAGCQNVGGCWVAEAGGLLPSHHFPLQLSAG